MKDARASATGKQQHDQEIDAGGARREEKIVVRKGISSLKDAKEGAGRIAG